MASKVIGDGAQSHWRWQLKAWRLKSNLNMRSEALRNSKNNNHDCFWLQTIFKNEKVVFFLRIESTLYKMNRFHLFAKAS